jgi:hypothetical protein
LCHWTRQNHLQTFRQILTTKDTYKWSFCPNTIFQWNILPQTVIASTYHFNFTDFLCQKIFWFLSWSLHFTNSSSSSSGIYQNIIYWWLLDVAHAWLVNVFQKYDYQSFSGIYFHKQLLHPHLPTASENSWHQLFSPNSIKPHSYDKM